jgi:glycosyltransferase involved in cell wall biosynthesis
MRVAIDARELCGHPTGVGRYLSGLLDAWSRSDAARRHQWTLVAPAIPDGADRFAASVKIVEGNGGTAWEQFSLPGALRADRPDVVFAPGYTAPLTVASPVVLSIHDVSYFAHPEWFAFREGLRRRWLTAWSARRAKAVITISRFSTSEIEKHIGIEPARIHVVPLGISLPDSGSPPALSAVEALAPGSRNPVVLYVGSVFERRRVDRLIESFDGVVARVPNARLEIVGENRTRQPRIDLDALRRRSAHADRITIRSYVDEATLAQLYRQASVFAFLSEYEGFGLTPLEALMEGVPPVVLDTAVARETCGEAARYVSASAGNDEIAAAIADLLSSPEARQHLLDRAGSVLARYDWDRAAAATLSVLEEAAGAR